MKNKILVMIIILTGIIGIASCKKFVDVGPPKNQLVASKAFADSASVNSAIAGIYVDMVQSFGFGFMSGGLTAYPGLSADELAQTTKDADISQLYSNQLSVQNSYDAILWSMPINICTMPTRAFRELTQVLQFLQRLKHIFLPRQCK